MKAPIDALHRTDRLLQWSLGLLLSLIGLACGGGGTHQGGSQAPTSVLLTPQAPTVKPGGQVGFQAVDDRGKLLVATYSIVEPDGGSIDAEGRYQAPLAAGTYHVQARASTGMAEATLRVEPYLGELKAAPDTQFSRFEHTASLLRDGSVLVFGGMESSLAERFLPGTGAFVPAGDSGLTRWSHTTSALPDGGLLIAGGLHGGQAVAGSTLYANGLFTALPVGMTTARYAHSAALLADGRVLLAGGLPAPGSDVQAQASSEVFDPAQRHFQTTGALNLPRAGHTATTLQDGSVLIAGGRDSTCLFNCPQSVWWTAERYDPLSGTYAWAGTMSQRRFGHTATLLPDGRVLIAGGTTPDLQNTDVSSLVEIYDPATQRFTTVGQMIRPRSRHTATLLGDGTVLFAGGETFGEGTLATSTVEAFDPLTGASRLFQSNQTTRYRHTATRLHSGQVLLVGGTEGGGGLTRVERFN